MPSIREFPFKAFVVEAAFLGDVAVFALGDGTVRRVDGAAGESAQVHGGAILSAAVAEGGRLLTGGDDGRVALTDAAGKSEILAERPRKWIDHVAAGPSGAIAFATGRLVAVRLKDGRERPFELPRAAGGLAFAPKGLRLAVSRYDGVTLFWAGTDAAPVKLEWKGAHFQVTFSPDGRFLVTSMQENALHGWRLEDSRDMRMSGYPAKPRSLSWSAKGRFLATSGANAAILWPFHTKDGPMGKAPLELGTRADIMVTSVCCHPAEDIVAIGYQDGMILGARFADGKEVLLRRPGKGAITAMAWNKDGRQLAFGSAEGDCGVVDIAG